jgi:UDP-N-acetylglucosamine 2-epimerase (non-hydrolysing)
VLFVFGSRPEAIKMAPVYRRVQADPQMEARLCVTAQHRHLLDQVLQWFGMVPHHDLNLMRPRQSLTYLASAALPALERVMREEAPDLVVVHGDTLTTFVGALSAFFSGIPVGHVEAGLRSYNLASPFPEEANRRLTDVLTHLHFAPTPRAEENLRRENLPPEGIYVTGNTAVDAFLEVTRPDYAFTDPMVARAVGDGRALVVCELHRRENWGEPMRQVCLGLRDVLQARPDVLALFSVHPNPAVEEVVTQVLGQVDNAWLVRPVSYPEWANVLSRARVVLSDSGGVQEEAPSAGVRVLLARTETERPEGVEAGTVRLVGVERDTVREALLHELDHPRSREEVASHNPYGDGRASWRIHAYLRYAFGLEATFPPPFSPRVASPASAGAGTGAVPCWGQEGPV